MRLDESQLTEYDERGYLFFPGLLDSSEVAVLQAAVPDLLRRRGPEVVRENEDEAARLVFGAHAVSEPFLRLPLLPRLLLPTRQLLDDDVYLHQTRLNPKEGFGGGGSSWAWHQDYPPWQKIDGMPEPRCVMAAVFIDDCTPVNSPLLVLPGSHHYGLMESSIHQDTVGRGYDLMHIDRDTLATLAAEEGIEPLVGPAGTVCFINCNIVHGSANNVSPYRRAIMYLIYNAVSNACIGGQRDWHHHNRDTTPLHPLADDALKTANA